MATVAAAAAAAAAAARRWAGSRAPLVPADGRTLADFISPRGMRRPGPLEEASASGASPPPAPAGAEGVRTYYVETYGCQMNVSDTEVVRALLEETGRWRESSAGVAGASLVLLNTCSIRANAEAKVRTRLRQLRGAYARAVGSGAPGQGPRAVGVLGCMAERLKERWAEEGTVDLVVGPDAYRSLVGLAEAAVARRTREFEADGWRRGPRRDGPVWAPRAEDVGVDVRLDGAETYEGVVPLRRPRPAPAVPGANDDDAAGGGQASAFLTITRGCNNLCAFCVVPYTRGRERSRPVDSIVDEARRLRDAGGREITLHGQNVNSNVWDHPREGGEEGDGAGAGAGAGARARARVRAQAKAGPPGDDRDPFGLYAAGFTTGYRPVPGDVRFAGLLARVAEAVPEARIRFTSPHPKDMADDVLHAVRELPNVCRQLHVPAQSGSTAVLARMGRGHTREAYESLVERARAIVGADVGLSSDFIAGFCGETEDDHAQTLDLVRSIGYDSAFLFAYSERPGTRAAKRLADDVPADVKSRRLSELVAAYRDQLGPRFQAAVGRRMAVLVDGPSRRDAAALVTGRTDCNKRVHFPATDPATGARFRAGDFLAVDITSARLGSLSGVAAFPLDGPSALAGSSSDPRA